MIIIMIVVKIPKIIGVIAIVSLLTITSVAQDYEYLNDNNILWESTTITTLNWTSPLVMAGESDRGKRF